MQLVGLLGTLSTIGMQRKGLNMSDIIKFREVEEKILDIRGQKVIIDREVADLYGVETKRINEAVANNPGKFPEGYIVAINAEELEYLRSKLSTANIPTMTRVPPKAFTEKGLYMLATILKSPVATQTTIAIVEAFANLRELSRTINHLPDVQDKKQQKALMQKCGKLFADMLDDNAFEVSGDETTVEIDLALIKIKHTVKRNKRSENTDMKGAESNNSERRRHINET